MQRQAILLAVFIAQAAASHGQSAPAFEVADVRPSPKTAVSMWLGARGGTPRDGVYRVWQATLVDLIRMAYGVDADRITGGPHWLEIDRFDIVATVPPDATRESARPMLQALLAERFGLVVRQESTAVSVYVPERGDAPLTLKETAAGTTPGCQPSVASPGGGRPVVTLVCRGTSMPALARSVADALGGRQVVDATGIPSLWDFDLVLPPQMAGEPDFRGVADGILKSTGLTLAQRSIPLPAIGVEHVNRAPTPSSPAVAAAFATGLEPEFEAAAIRPSPPGAQQGRHVFAGSQLTGTAVSVRQMLALAYQLPDEGALIVGPRALDARRWDVIAKLPAQSARADALDIDAIGRMMQRLLAERFRLKARFEERPIDAPTLVAAGTHTLTKSDPDVRTRCTRSRSTQGWNVVIECQNISLSELANRLQGFDEEAFTMPVADQTGIDGRWNLTLTFVPASALRSFIAGVNAGRAAAALQGGADSARARSASAPINAITIADAIRRQLGLRIEMRRRPVPVLVIDSMDETPAEN